MVTHWMGIPIHESPLCKRTVPARTPKTANARIRKKWLKRYGTVEQDLIYIVNGGKIEMMIIADAFCDIADTAVNAMLKPNHTIFMGREMKTKLEAEMARLDRAFLVGNSGIKNPVGLFQGDKR